MATAGDDAIVRVFDAGTGALIFSYRGHLKAVKGTVFVGGRLATASADGTIRIWDLEPDWQALVHATGRIIPRRELTPAELQRAFLTTNEASIRDR